MPHCKGVIQQIQVRELAAPDQYDNVAKLALKINDLYYDFGGAKSDKFTIKQGKDWIELSEGDTVEFMHTEREYKEKTYRDAKRSQVTLVAKGSGKAPEAPKAAPATNGAAKAASAPTARTTASGGTDWARKDAGAAASASIDKAIRYFGIVGFPEVNPPHGDFNRNMEAILNVARTMNGLTTTLLEEILAGGIKAEAKPESVVKAEAPKATAPKKAAAKPAPALRESWEDEEDEIPF